MFISTLKKPGCSAEQCVFVDNSVSNLLVAQDLGIQTILFHRDGVEYEGRVVDDFDALGPAPEQQTKESFVRSAAQRMMGGISMKMCFRKWFMMLVLVLFLPMGEQMVYAQEVLKLAELDSSTGISDTDYYSYTYTEENRVTIAGTEYAGIVIPLEQAYAGGIQVFINGIENVTTSDGEVYCGLFDDESLSVGELKKASREMAELYKGYGETGIRYLVFYNDTYEGDSLTTDIQFQAGLRYENSYEMKENIVYKNYAKDSENSNSAYINITKPGYYIFETDKDLTLWMSLSQKALVIPAYNTPIVGDTDHKVMIHLRDVGRYDLSMTSNKGVPFSFTYCYLSEKLEFTQTNAVPICIGDKTAGVSINYTADKTGIVQVAGVSKGSEKATIKQFYKDGKSIGYDRVISTSPEVTDATKESFFVRKGEQYYFCINATSGYGYVNASFKIAGFVEADVLGKTTQDEARSAKAGLKYDTTYYGTIERDVSTSSWIYIDKPCRVHFKNNKKGKAEGYTLTYYDDNRRVWTAYVQDYNKEGQILVLEDWTPGFLEINDGAGNGHYTLMLENMSEDKTTAESDKTENTGETVPNVGKILKGSNAKYKVTVAPKKDSKTGGTVSYMKVTNKNAKTVTVPNTVKINGVTYKVTSIGNSAFNGCKKLKKVTLGKNITTIGDKAFYKCSALTKITIPSKVSKIGKSAFQNCKKLKNITIKTTKLTSQKVGKNAFKGVGSSYYKKVEVKVPAKKLKSYKTLLKKAGLSSKAKVKK